MGFSRRHLSSLAIAILGGSAGLALIAPALAGPAPQKTATPTATRSAGAPLVKSRTISVKSRTIRVEAQLQVGEELDLGAPGRSVGDQFIFSGNLLSKRPADRVVGRMGGYCVITDLGRNSGQCLITAVLAGGQITVQGEQLGIPTPSPVTNAITGGTGEFREARGQMTLRVLTPATWDLTFQVTGVLPQQTGDTLIPSEAPSPTSPGK